MQLLYLIINLVLNIGLFGLTGWAFSIKKENGLSIFTTCAYLSAALVTAHLLLCIWRMFKLWRQEKRDQSLMGLMAIVALVVGAYYLTGGYLLLMLMYAGPIGGDPPGNFIH